MTGGGMQRPFSGFPAQMGGMMQGLAGGMSPGRPQQPMTGGGMQQPGPAAQRAMMSKPMAQPQGRGTGGQMFGGGQGQQQVMQALMSMFGGRR
jgi:hypothetical protein